MTEHQRVPVGVRFKEAGKVYYFDAGEHELDVGNYVVVETSHGLEVGRVVIAPDQVLASEIKESLKPIVRIATREDIDRAQELKERAQEQLREAKRRAGDGVLRLAQVVRGAVLEPPPLVEVLRRGDAQDRLQRFLDIAGDHLLGRDDDAADLEPVRRLDDDVAADVDVVLAGVEVVDLARFLESHADGRALVVAHLESGPPGPWICHRPASRSLTALGRSTGSSSIIASSVSAGLAFSASWPRASPMARRARTADGTSHCAASGRRLSTRSRWTACCCLPAAMSMMSRQISSQASSMACVPARSRV